MSEFVNYLSEVFEGVGKISSRRMFGGYGIYLHDRMFGLVADDVLYLKADAETVHLFEELGLTPFEFDKKGKPVKMSFYLAPEEIYDDPEIAIHWGERAYAAALRAKPNK